MYSTLTASGFSKEVKVGSIVRYEVGPLKYNYAQVVHIEEQTQITLVKELKVLLPCDIIDVLTVQKEPVYETK